MASKRRKFSPPSRRLWPRKPLINPPCKALVPYKLERSNLILFPEWYSLFIRRAKRVSKELNVYCSNAPSSFRDCFVEGDRVDIEREIRAVIEQFSNSVKASMGASLQVQPEDPFTLFSREYMEGVFLDSIHADTDRSPIAARTSQLIQLAKGGKLRPLVEFFKAYCVGEEAIWNQLLGVCLPAGVSEETRSAITARFEAAKNLHKPTVDDSALGVGRFDSEISHLQKSLKEGGFFPIPEPKIPSVPSGPAAQKRPFPEVEASEEPRGAQRRLTTVSSRIKAFRKWQSQK